MNKVKYLVYQIKIGLVIGLLTALTGCATYGGGGYYNNGYSDVGDGYLFGGSYDNGRDVHNYSQRGSASRGAAHPAGGGHTSGGGGGRR
jgi:hypothetical protein